MEPRSNRPYGGRRFKSPVNFRTIFRPSPTSINKWVNEVVVLVDVPLLFNVASVGGIDTVGVVVEDDDVKWPCGVSIGKPNSVTQTKCWAFLNRILESTIDCEGVKWIMPPMELWLRNQLNNKFVFDDNDELSLFTVLLSSEWPIITRSMRILLGSLVTAVED